MISWPEKLYSKHVKQLSVGHFLSNGTVKDLVITWSNCTIPAILPCVKCANVDA